MLLGGNFPNTYQFMLKVIILGQINRNILRYVVAGMHEGKEESNMQQSLMQETEERNVQQFRMQEETDDREQYIITLLLYFTPKPQYPNRV